MMKSRTLFCTLFSFAYFFANATVVDLSVSETANCYIVAPGSGNYCFNALVKGNGVAPYGEESRIKDSGIQGVKVLWQDAAVIDESSVCYSKGRISFKTVGKMTTGNAVIAIYRDKDCSDGNCIWSWHIWMTDAKDMEMAGIKFLDRNLGSDGKGLRENGRNGLFYQWGRKDPFPQNGAFPWTVVEGKHSVEFVCANPTVFVTRNGRWADSDCMSLWCKGSTQKDCQTACVSPATKTMYDPCPAGYHVPNRCDIVRIKASGKHSFEKAGARWYDMCPVSPDKVGELGYYWCATTDVRSLSRASDYYIWNVGVGLALGTSYYICSAFCIRPQKF